MHYNYRFQGAVLPRLPRKDQTCQVREVSPLRASRIGVRGVSNGGRERSGGGYRGARGEYGSSTSEELLSVFLCSVPAPWETIMLCNS